MNLTKSTRIFPLIAACLAAMLAAGCTAPSTAEYYGNLQKLYTLTGRMRTETAPPDAPISNADLVRNFESIAFHTEFTRDEDKLIEEVTPTELVKWEGDVTYQIAGDAAGPTDIAQMQDLARRLSRLTGLNFVEVDEDPNILILIASRELRNSFVAEASAKGLGDRLRLMRQWSVDDRFPCVGQIGHADLPDGRRQYAIIGIKAETKGLFRQSCLHEEFVQTLGLMNDDPEVRPSIFNDDQEFALLTKHDEYLLRILYDPRLTYGMSAEEGMPIVRQIVAEIGPGE